MPKVTIKVKLAWWYKYLYLPYVKFGAFFGIEPNWSRFEEVTIKASKTEVVEYG